jgi:hypothetical protein
VATIAAHAKLKIESLSNAEISRLRDRLETVARKDDPMTANSVGLLARTGYLGNANDPERLRSDLIEHRERLNRGDVNPDDILESKVATRRVLNHLIENYDKVAKSPYVRSALDELKGLQRARAAERGNYADVRSQFLTQAWAQGIEPPESILPGEYSHLSDLPDNVWGDASKALKDEVKADRAKVKTLRGQARTVKARVGEAAKSAGRRIRGRDMKRLARWKKKRPDGSYTWRKGTPQVVKDYFHAKEALSDAQAAKRKADKDYGNRARNKSAVVSPDESLAKATRAKEGAEAKVATLRRKLEDAEKRLETEAELHAGRRAQGEEFDPSLAQYGRGGLVGVERGRARQASLERRAQRLDERARAKEQKLNRASRARTLEKEALNTRSTVERAAKFREAERLMGEVRGQEMKELRRWEERVRKGNMDRGWEDSVYIQHTSALNSHAGRPPLGDVGGHPRVGKEKMKTNWLEERGVVDEHASTLLQNLYNNRVQTELQSLIGRVFETEARFDGRNFTSIELADLKRNGMLRDDDVAVPLGEYRQALMADPGDALTDIGETMAVEIRKGEYKEGSKYTVMSKEAWKELQEQLHPIEQGFKQLRILTRASSLALLGTSPTWFQFQLAATPFVMLLHNANPRTYYNAVRTYWKMTPRERAEVNAMYGGVSAGVLTIEDLSKTLGGTDPGKSSMWTSAAGRSVTNVKPSPAAKFLRIVNKGTSLRKGGPLVIGNRAYEAKLRAIAGLAEMDKVQNPSAYRRTIESFGLSTKLTEQSVAKLKGKTLREVADYYTKRPDEADNIVKAINDALGDWVTMTSRERRTGAFAAFYPFLRFSIRWTFKTFPRDHPGKAAIVYNLAQLNSQQLYEIWGGQTPSFLGDWGTGVSYTGEYPGQEEGINLARIAPGSNAIIEALGGNRTTEAKLTAPLSPALNAAVQGYGARNPYTGEDLSPEEDRGVVGNVLTNFGNLVRPAGIPEQVPGTDIDNPLYREQSPTSAAFQAIQGDTRSPLEKSLYPDLFQSPERQKYGLELSGYFRAAKSSDEGGGRPGDGEMNALSNEWEEAFTANTEAGMGKKAARQKANADVNFGQRIKEMRARWDEAEAAQKKINAITEAMGTPTPEIIDDQSRKKWGMVRRRVTGEFTGPTPRRKAGRRNRAVAKGKLPRSALPESLRGGSESSSGSGLNWGEESEESPSGSSGGESALNWGDGGGSSGASPEKKKRSTALNWGG